MNKCALGYQAYMEIECYKCKTWGECQTSNIEDCVRRDEEIEKMIKEQQSASS